MKIVYCLPHVYKPGGIERIVSIKANYLADKANYDVYIITSCQNGKKPFYYFSPKIKFIDLGIDYDNTLNLPLWIRIYKKKQLQKKHKSLLTSHLNTIKADIVISTFTHEAEFLPKIKDGSKKILEFHFCRGHKKLMANAFHFPLITKILYYYKCWLEENVIIPKFDQFIVLTEEDQEQWKSKIPNAKYIPNIIPFESNDQALLINKKVIAVGRLDAQKRFDKLILLWGQIHKKNPAWKLNIYGQGKDEKQLRKLIESLHLENCITINKPSQNIKEEYLQASIFVMTSAYEGLPMTLLEATSLGLPAVCYAFKCGPKDIIKTGMNGYLIKENDSESFISAIQELINNEDLRKKMGHKAKIFSEKYSKEIVMQQWINLFKQITNK